MLVFWGVFCLFVVFCYKECNLDAYVVLFFSITEKIHNIHIRNTSLFFVIMCNSLLIFSICWDIILLISFGSLNTLKRIDLKSLSTRSKVSALSIQGFPYLDTCMKSPHSNIHISSLCVLFFVLKSWSLLIFMILFKFLFLTFLIHLCFYVWMSSLCVCANHRINTMYLLCLVRLNN